MNSQSFDLDTPNGRKHFQKLLDTLIDYNGDSEEKYYNDIHIKQEMSLIILEWDTIPYSGEWGGQFRYIDWDDVVLKEVEFPDGHHEYLFPEDVENTLKEWHENHPEWVQTPYGTWTNQEENRIYGLDFHSSDHIKRPINNVWDISIAPSDVSASEYFADIILQIFEETKKESLITRTDYIAVGPTAYKLLKKAEKVEGVDIELLDVEPNGFPTKVGTLTLELENQCVKITPLYELEKAKDEIWFLTDNNYLLHKIKIETGESEDNSNECKKD